MRWLGSRRKLRLSAKKKLLVVGDKPRLSKQRVMVVGVNPLPKTGEAARLDQTGKTTSFRLARMAREAKARVDKARARARHHILLLPTLQLLLVGVQLLLQELAGLAPTSVLIAGKRDTTRTRAPNLPLRTRSGILDGRYWFWSVLQPVHPQGERT